MLQAFKNIDLVLVSMGLMVYGRDLERGIRYGLRDVTTVFQAF